jgi:TonB family protein
MKSATRKRKAILAVLLAVVWAMFGGQAVGEEDSPPVIIKTSEPRYPDKARLGEVGGTVEVAITVSAEGKPIEVEVVRSAHPLLDREVGRAAWFCRFTPAMVGGRAAVGQVLLEAVHSSRRIELEEAERDSLVARLEVLLPPGERIIDLRKYLVEHPLLGGRKPLQHEFYLKTGLDEPIDPSVKGYWYLSADIEWSVERRIRAEWGN